MKYSIAAIALTLTLAGCAPESEAPTAESPQPAEGTVSIYAAAVADPSRPEADLARDAGRKPAEVMKFIGIERGDDVLEMFAGGGYYTELLAYVVGDNGTVTSHMSETMLQFSGDEFTARHADNRLPNVNVLMAENNELALDADEYDAITMVLNYHDLYWVSVEYGWKKFDVPKFLAELHKGLKPGGTLGIIDHNAEAGSARETGGTLHRIDPSIVISELEAAGFVLYDSSDLLRNVEDDHSKGVFAPEIRGKTDRFVLRFGKPE